MWYIPRWTQRQRYCRLTVELRVVDFARLYQLAIESAFCMLRFAVKSQEEKLFCAVDIRHNAA